MDMQVVPLCTYGQVWRLIPSTFKRIAGVSPDMSIGTRSFGYLQLNIYIAIASQLDVAPYVQSNALRTFR